MKKYFRECNRYFSYMHLWELYTVAKFQSHSYNNFQDMNYYPVTGGRTESDAYESTVQYEQVGSKSILKTFKDWTWDLNRKCNLKLSGSALWECRPVVGDYNLFYDISRYFLHCLSMHDIRSPWEPVDNHIHLCLFYQE